MFKKYFYQFLLVSFLSIASFSVQAFSAQNLINSTKDQCLASLNLYPSVLPAVCAGAVAIDLSSDLYSCYERGAKKAYTIPGIMAQCTCLLKMMSVGGFAVSACKDKDLFCGRVSTFKEMPLSRQLYYSTALYCGGFVLGKLQQYLQTQENIKNSIVEVPDMKRKLKSNPGQASLYKPKMVINKIENQTLYKIAVLDRLHKFKQICVLQPKQTLSYFDFTIKDSRNIIFSGSLKDNLRDYGQFSFIEMNNNDEMLLDRESYINFAMMPGGVNDGSNITSGQIGSCVFKFMTANETEGCTFNSVTLEKKSCDCVKIDLQLTITNENLKQNKFGLNVDYSIIEE